MLSSLKRAGYTYGLGTLITISSWLMRFKDGFSVVNDWARVVYSWPFDGLAGTKKVGDFELPFRYLDPESQTLDCKYTCHYKCINDVGLDCMESPELRIDVPDHSPQHTLVSVEDVENEAESFVFLTREELEPKIDEFNTLRDPKSETMTLGEEGTQFSGQVSVHINLARPVSVRTGCPLPDICISTLKQYEHSIDTNKKRTTFFLPKATTQDVNLSCYTSAQDVIRNVLAKLQLIDNPRKFALFERTEHNGEVFMRKMVDEDKPLFWCLGWVNSTGTKRFELRENETGVIEWEAFTVPELQNFLRILDKEEEEYVQKVRSKYLKYQSLLQEAHQAGQEQEAKVKEQQIQQEQGCPIAVAITA